MKHTFTSSLIGGLILAMPLSVAAGTDLKMVKANEFTGATKAHAGTDLGKGYTGKGVVIAIIDNGFDVDHPAFRDADGNCRVKAYFKDAQRFTENLSETIGYSEEWHGTHVAGIATGSTSSSVIGSYVDYKGVMHEGEQIPFQGVAPDADIVFVNATEENYHTAMAAIKDYAAGRPVVFNISAGKNMGWHDGMNYRSLVNYLKEEGAIVCVAAGNEGQQNLGVVAEAPAGETVTKIFPMPVNAGSSQLYMMSNRSTPIEAELVAFNKDTKAEIYSIALSDGLTLGTFSDGVHGGEAWENTFKGPTSNTSVWVRNVSGSATECYKYEVSFNYVPVSASTVVGLRVKVSDGEKVMATVFSNKDDVITVFPEPEIDGWVKASPEGSITTLSTVPGVICVGACSSADAHPMLDEDGNSKGLLSQSTKEGQVWPMTSYGTSMSTDEALPHVCAPGVDVISAISNKSSYSMFENSAAFTDELFDGLYNYIWGPSTGTSMATPYVAGTIALWLEANPNLTADEIKNIIAQTSTKKEGDPRWGAGIINPYEGLRQILGMSGIANTVAGHEPMINITPNGIEVVAAASGVTAELYDLSGRRVAAVKSQTNEVAISTESLMPGMYVLRVNDGTNSISRKIMTR